MNETVESKRTSLKRMRTSLKPVPETMPFSVICVYRTIHRILRVVAAVSLAAASTAAAASDARATTDTMAGSYVKPLDLALFQTRYSALPSRDRDLIDLYLAKTKPYVLTVEDGAIPLTPDNYYRNLAERAHGAVVLAAVANDWPDDLKQKCRDQSVRFIAEFVAQYKKHPLFNNPWQSSWWVGEMGMAAWFVWDRLDAGLQNDVAGMVAFHADRIAALKPLARVKGDTQAETDSWNSTVVALALNMMPRHPHNAAWREAALRYAYAVFGTAADLSDDTLGDDGRPVKDWVVGANLHDDFSLENHNRFHVGYVYAAYRFLIQDAALFRLGGRPIPLAFRHHIEDVHREIILPCMNGGKYAVFVSDNDWKRYHLWTESPVVHGYVSLLERSRLASALEEESLRRSVAAWDRFPDGFQFDNAYVCGKPWTPRIADIVLLHLLSRPAPPPMAADEVESRLAGVRQKRDVNLLSQYSRGGSFRSFFWGPGPVVRQIEPKDNSWMMLPLRGNYRPVIDGKPGPDEGAQTTCGKGDDWFWVIRNYPRGEQEAFISLPDEIVVIMNSVALKTARTIDSSVAVEKPYTDLTVYYEGGKATFRNGGKQWDRTDAATGVDLDSRWVNLSDSIGFVPVNLTTDSAHMILPEPGVRSALHLRRVANPSGAQRFITVVFTNQSHEQTRAAASQISGSCGDGVMTCRAPGYFVWANFSDRPVTLDMPDSVSSVKRVNARPKSAGFVRLVAGRRASPR